MKGRLLALLLLALLLLAGYFAVTVVQNRYTSYARTFKFLLESISSGPPLHGGGFTDVICIERLPNGEAEARILVEHILMLDVCEVEINGCKMLDITLRVTAAQAESLEQAQNRGVLYYSLYRADQSKSIIETVRQYLVGPDKVTAADLLKGE